VLSLNEINGMRIELIKKGKRHPRFAQLKYKVPPNEEAKAKYCDVDDVENSGAIGECDVAAIMSLMKKYQPKTIIEIGTWFGTSAMVMDKACSGSAEIYTCDKNNVYVYDSKRVHYYNNGSGNFLSKMKKAGVVADFAFVDGLIVEDVKKLLRRMSKEGVIFLHDYKKPLKGYRNGAALLSEKPKSKIVKVGKDTALWVP